MSDIEMREYVPGAPWKALITRGADGEYTAHVWAIDGREAPHHAEGANAIGLDLDHCVCAAGGFSKDSRATLFRVPAGERDALEAALRARIPDVEFVPEDNPWVFG